MHITTTNTKPQSETASDKVLYCICDTVLFLALSILAIIHTVFLWLPLCLLDHSLRQLCTRDAHGSGARS